MMVASYFWVESPQPLRDADDFHAKDIYTVLRTPRGGCDRSAGSSQLGVVAFN